MDKTKERYNMCDTDEVIIKIAVDVVASTGLSIQVVNLDDKLVWVNMAYIEDFEGDKNYPETISIPSCLASEKGLV